MKSSNFGTFGTFGLNHLRSSTNQEPNETVTRNSSLSISSQVFTWAKSSVQAFWFSWSHVVPCSLPGVPVSAIELILPEKLPRPLK